MPTKDQVAVVGAGFTGLAAAYELVKQGISVRIFEASESIGGLAAAFCVGDKKLDRFYHHWFTSDLEVMKIIEELGLSGQVVINPTNTGIYFANRIFRLSEPLDLLKFSPLSFVDRLRLGIMTLRARRVVDWRELENKSAREWLVELGGENVYRVVWEPLLRGKFGAHAEEISAVWFWNKLKLRGGSRSGGGKEMLAYFRGGFVALADAIATEIGRLGGSIELRSKVMSIDRCNGSWRIATERKEFFAERVVVTPALPLIAEMIRSWATAHQMQMLSAIKYIGNICLVMELDRSLSATYWLNVNDPQFPFVGVIEHTNFQNPEEYGGRHIVYLSKYLPHTDERYQMSSDELLAYTLPYLKVMFPKLDRDWIKDHHLWRARWAQPIVGKGYGRIVPPQDGLAPGLHICTMAQIYPEDRGTNYAVREGRKLGMRLGMQLRAGN